MNNFFLLILVAVVLIIIWGIAIYNKLIASRQKVGNAFSQIDVQLKRRRELVPNLVETVKGYMAHERDTLENVINARARAVGASDKISSSPENLTALKETFAAEDALGRALGRLMALVENYPDLKANQNMMQLSEELTSTENRVSFARQAYNDVVMAYNTLRETFPNNFIADSFNFAEAPFFSITDESEREAVKVSF